MILHKQAFYKFSGVSRRPMAQYLFLLSDFIDDRRAELAPEISAKRQNSKRY
jgi:hypothetical protein